MVVCLTNLPEEILDSICSHLSLDELSPLLFFPLLRSIAKKRLFNIVRFEDKCRSPPTSAWSYIRRLECYNVKFSDIALAIKNYPNLQQLVLDDDCQKDSDALVLPKVHTLILGNSMSSELELPHDKFKMLAVTVTSNNWATLRSVSAKVLHLTIDDYQAFVNLLPFLDCDELYIYGDDYCNSNAEEWKFSKKFNRLNLCGVLPNQFVHQLLQNTSSRQLTLELIEISGNWRFALANHSKIHVLIHEESIIEDTWYSAIDTLHINGTLINEAASMCGWAKRIVFDKCLTGILQDNLELLFQNNLGQRLEMIVFKNYDTKISKLEFPMKTVKIVNSNTIIV